MPLQSRVAQGASNACRPAIGGCIFAGARSAAISVAAIRHQISTHQNTMPRRIIRLSVVSSRESSGSTTTEQEISSLAQASRLPRRILQNNQCPDPLDVYPQTGKSC